MKERIEELAREICKKSNLPEWSIVRLHAIDALNEALEMAAKECENKERRKWKILQHGGQLEGIGPLDCAEAIRKLKCS